MRFVYSQKVLFRHCDPAGIVFYPRYFEMMNDCVEAFFENVLEFPFSKIHTTGGVPTAEISTRFTAPSRLGDALDIALLVDRVGVTSMSISIIATSNGDQRFVTKSTLVLVKEAGKPREWPADIRQKLTAYMETNKHGI